MMSCYSDDSGAASAADFLPLSGHDYSSGDLYELVARGGGCLAVSKPQVHMPEVLPRVPPSQGEMAAGWLHPIIRHGQARTSDDDDFAGQAAHDRLAPANLDKELPTTENILTRDTPSNSRARRKTGGGARRTNYVVAHSQTEKRRRSKITGSLKTLQQLVPGCDKLSNQASTLDQTIQYVKSLQHQVQAMSVPVHCSMRPVTVAPGIHVRPAVLLRAPPPMVPFAPMIPSVMMPATMIYRPTAALDVAHARWLSSGHK